MNEASGSAHARPRTLVRYIVLLLLLLLFLAWYIAILRVEIHFSKDGSGSLGYILNIQHDIDKHDIYPGQTRGGSGHIFPDDDFFMKFDWNNAGRHHCICISPKWPLTTVHIGPGGNVDWRPSSGTDVDRIWPCDYGGVCQSTK